jgi:GNAT superfamily N-acetyltransferase
VFLRRSEDEDLVGASVGEVVALYVRAAAWGGGGGRALLEAARSEFTLAGYEYATLWVLATNAAARTFYERCGWEADGATKIHDWEAFTAEDVRYRAALDRGSHPGG